MSSFSLNHGHHMCAGLRNWTWTLLLLLLLLLPLNGIRTDYGVEYPLANICVLENSSVFIPCTFFYPAGYSVTRVMWGHERNDLYEGPFLYDSDNLNLTSRFRYNGDKKNNCSFTIQNVGRNDSGKYAFRFETTEDTGKFTGITGSVLQVFELSARRLQPSVGGTIKEGDSVHLECENPCNRTHQSITWFKNGAPVREGSKLDLGPVSPSDSGNYTCSLSDHLGTTTAAVHVDVEYGPKNTRASPPMEIDNGTRVSLVCQSLANPPVKSYVWFRIIDGVQEVGNQSVWVTSENGEYFCRATNKHGSQNSSIVTVEIKGIGHYSTYIMIPIGLLLVLIIVVVVVVVAMRFKKNTKRVREAEGGEDCPNQTYANCSITQLAERNQEVRTAEDPEVIYSRTAPSHLPAAGRKRRSFIPMK
ncbi:sialoadhesin-like isoform X1 [Takifugu rubripes]|uniref:sialoadhesin-like isoform X1 n=1 Tax=Takifugu rubripes TaxID=31033 RepID=UPI001145ACFB|nr:sialoadhesin-like isoform X1 [Takifugu rubripes]XP_029691761.1 sialoadhesin-like isoform X1 [Takifugu rubripes]